MATLTIPRVYPITDRGLSKLTHAEQVKRLIEGGARLIQIREKELSPREILVEARMAVSIARSCGAKIIINDRADIGVAAGADGVHLGQDDLPPEAARRILGESAIIGFSTHNLEQARAAVLLPVDYIAIGPVFETHSKSNPDRVVGLDGFKRVRDMVKNLPLVAIGGITQENAHELFRAGADSVALISALLKNGDTISERTAAFIKSV